MAQKGSAKKRLSSGALMMVLFSTAIFVSAALLFLIEPMFAKFVLPTFGGTPAVWTGSMMFFQAALLASYLYVHATTSWLGARRQAILHLVVVLLPLLVLPVAVPAGEWAPSADDNPLFWLLGLLFVSVGLPFFAVSATNPLIQRWLSETDHPDARDPYFLYRASNLGSVIGLLSYPILLEPSLRLHNQGIFWSVGYGLFIVLVFVSAVMLWRSAPATATTQDEDLAAAEGSPNPPVAAGGGAPETGASLSEAVAAGLSGSPTLLRRLRWIGLAFVPSSMMLGVTAFITTDVAPVPLLWVIPLSLYLFSFVIVFARSERMPGLIRRAMVFTLPIAIGLLVFTMLINLLNPLWLLILLHLFGFFVVAMVLHGELARDRPPARHLTEFYLWVAVGGVLGGVFNALVAPVTFHSVVEYPLAVVLACLFLPPLFGQEEAEGSIVRRARWLGPRLLDLAMPLALGLAVAALVWAISWSLGPVVGRVAFIMLIALATGLCLYFAYSSNRPIRFGLGIAALVVASTIMGGSQTLYGDRSFFGVYKVINDEQTGYRLLEVGNTNHGAQLFGVTPPEPTTYHHRTGPIGQIFDALPNEDTTSRTAVLGLGTGSMACYNKPGQRMTFYEIDPLVERIARNPNLFTYLRDCPGESEVVLGDARLKMAEAPDGEYGVIVADAFNSDAVPVHLLTGEAVDLYLSKLRSDGVLVFHVTNRYLELEPVLGDLAQNRGLSCYGQYDLQTQGIPFKTTSHWVAMAREDADLGSVPDDQRWHPCFRKGGSEDDVWTDDFSNLLSTFTWR